MQMNLIFHYKNKLIIHLIPINLWLMGILIIGSSAVFLLIFDNYSTLNCVRTNQNQGACTIAIYSQTKTSTLDFPLNDLISARVSQQAQWYEDEESYVVILRMSDREIPLNQYSTGGYKGHTRIVEKITAFLEDPNQTNLAVKQSSRPLMFLYSTLICLVGLGLLLLSKRMMVSLDREQGIASIQGKNVFTRSDQEIPLGELVKADIEELIGENKFRVTLVRQNGKRTPLSRYSTISYKGVVKIVAEINRFLKQG
jgi:hypothetical protein